MDLKPFNHLSDLSVIGVDEAGRGPLAGAVVAAAVILPDGFQIEGLTDSKKLSEKKRNVLYQKITHHCCWSVGESSSVEIDELNKEKKRDQNIKWREENKEKIRERRKEGDKKYRELNKEKLREKR